MKNKNMKKNMKKKKCDVHYENLQFYVRLGFKLKKYIAY